ncbi:MAG: hypothetical protein NVS1B9_04240 [Solirubrobacteraceae bacterium]
MQLTYDDGPDPEWTPRVLTALAGRRATFFVLAPRARAHPQLIAAMLAGGHAVELHGTAHLRHSEVGRDELRADTAAALVELARLGVRPSRWRAPWGIVTKHTEELADQFGLTLVGWTHDTHDWRGDSAAAMLAALAPPLAADAVVLMHDALGPGAQRAGCEQTVALTQMLLET